MSSAPRQRLLFGLAVAALAWCSARAQEPRTEQAPMRVLTDSAEYCEQLSTRVSGLQQARSHPSAEAEQLTREGLALCLHGRVRAGIARLRRAIVLLRYPATPSGE